MRDMKAEKDLGGSEHWPELPVLKVPGNPAALPWDLEQYTKEEIQDSWRTVAVLRVSDGIPSCAVRTTRFTVAFRNYEGRIIRLADPIETRKDTPNGRIGMRIGHEDVEFILIPERPTDRLTIELDCVAAIDDPDWTDLPLY